MNESLSMSDLNELYNKVALTAWIYTSCEDLNFKVRHNT